MEGTKIGEKRLIALDEMDGDQMMLEHNSPEDVGTEPDVSEKRSLGTELAQMPGHRPGEFPEECLVKEGDIRISTVVGDNGRVVYRYYNNGTIQEAKEVKVDLGFGTEATEDEVDFLRSLEVHVKAFVRSSAGYGESGCRVPFRETGKAGEGKLNTGHVQKIPRGTSGSSSWRSFYSILHLGRYTKQPPNAMEMGRRFLRELANGSLLARIAKGAVCETHHDNDTFRDKSFFFARCCHRIRGISYPGELLTSIARHRLLLLRATKQSRREFLEDARPMGTMELNICSDSESAELPSR
jgi:hypothetical protein